MTSAILLQVCNTEDPINKSIVKYRNHLSAPALGELCNRAKEFPFAFSLVDWEETLKEIVNLDISKTRQNTDMPTKIIKDISDIFFFCLTLPVLFRQYFSLNTKTSKHNTCF